MLEVVGLHRYPLTGARAENLEAAPINANGIIGDRAFVLYDTAIDHTEEPNRIGQKRHRQLATVNATVTLDNRLFYRSSDGSLDGSIRFDHLAGTDTYVNEFGEITPSHDLGDKVAGDFAQFLGLDTVRMAMKSAHWRNASSGDVAQRKVAPLHVIFGSSVRALQEMSGNPDIQNDRFRSNIVVDGDFEAFREYLHQDSQLFIGNITSRLSVRITGLTPRCAVTGYDQETGVNKKDVPKLFKQLEQQDGTPVFGLYGFALVSPGEAHMIRIGDEVSF